MRLNLFPTRAQLLEQCPATQFSEGPLDHLNSANETVKVLYQTCAYPLLLSIADGCDTVHHSFTVIVSNYGPFVDRPILKNYGRLVRVHLQSYLDLHIASACFADFNENDPLVVKFGFADNNEEQESWIHFNRLTNQFMGHGSARDLSEGGCLNRYDDAQTSETLQNGTVLAVQSRACIYNISIIFTDTYVTESWNFSIVLYNREPYFQRDLLAHDKNKRNVSVHLNSYMDFFVEADVVHDLDERDAVTYTVK